MFSTGQTCTHCHRNPCLHAAVTCQLCGYKVRGLPSGPIPHPKLCAQSGKWRGWRGG